MLCIFTSSGSLQATGTWTHPTQIESKSIYNFYDPQWNSCHYHHIAHSNSDHFEQKMAFHLIGKIPLPRTVYNEQCRKCILMTVMPHFQWFRQFHFFTSISLTISTPNARFGVAYAWKWQQKSGIAWKIDLSHPLHLLSESKPPGQYCCKRCDLIHNRTDCSVLKNPEDRREQFHMRKLRLTVARSPHPTIHRYTHDTEPESHSLDVRVKCIQQL